MLGAVWLRECDMDTGSFDQLEPYYGAKLRICGHWICYEHGVPCQESVASRECGGGQGQSGAGHRSSHIARWVGYCYQIYLLCVSLIASYIAPRFTNLELQSRESGYNIWDGRWKGRGGREDDQVANGALIRHNIHKFPFCVTSSFYCFVLLRYPADLG